MPFYLSKIFILSFIVTAIITPLAILIAPKIGAMDIPKDSRRAHKRPVPRFGGIAIYCGILVAFFFLRPLGLQTKGLLIGSTLILLVGVYDDLKDMPAKIKLIFQLIAAFILWYCNIRLTGFSNPFSGQYVSFPDWLSLIVTLFWIVGITNTINLIDGLDGLAAGITFIASVAVAYTAYSKSMWDTLVLVLAIAGACLAFLIYNSYPAKIFMGDAGALLLGFLMSSVSLIGIAPSKSSMLFATIVPVSILALPIFDTSFAILRRAINHKPIMQADRGHLHHRIMSMGFGQRRTVLTLYCISGIMSVAGILWTMSMLIEAIILAFIAMTLIVVFLGIGKIRETHNSEETVGAADEITSVDPGRIIKVMLVFGTRPEAIKMAPLVKTLMEDPCFDVRVCVSAQHREMLDQVLELFDIKPDYDLNIMKPGQSLSMITSGVLSGMDKVLEIERPDIVLVHGDTSTSFVAALAAFYHRIPVGHVEAGLRTHDRYSPYPEEMNRQMTGRLADIHFAPTKRNVENLKREGITKNVYITGNTVIDALIDVAKRPYALDLDVDFNKRIITVTCHRRENLGEYMANIFSALADIAREYKDVEIVYPVHLNPAVRQEAERYLGGLSNVRLIEPLTYQPFTKLLQASYLVVTDSGGIQEEAPALGKPVLVVRKETERPEAVEAGTVKLAGVDRETIYGMIKELLENKESYSRMAEAVNPYGDGKASLRIAAALKEFEKDNNSNN